MSVIVKKTKSKVSVGAKKKLVPKKTLKPGSYESVMKAVNTAQKNPISFINQW